MRKNAKFAEFHFFYLIVPPIKNLLPPTLIHINIYLWEKSIAFQKYHTTTYIICIDHIVHSFTIFSAVAKTEQHLTNHHYYKGLLKFSPFSIVWNVFKSPRKSLLVSKNSPEFAPPAVYIAAYMYIYIYILYLYMCCVEYV